MLTLALLLATLGPESLADQIARCGVARSQIKLRNEDILETAVISTPAAALTSDHLACLVGLALGKKVFVFADPAAQARFDPLLEAAQRQANQAKARQWLSDQGLLARLPAYDPARGNLADFGVAIETLCGISPRSMLKPREAELVFVPPSDPMMDEAELKRFECLVSAIVVSDPDRRIFVIEGN